MFKRMIYLGVTVLPTLTGLPDPLAPAAAQELLFKEIHRMVPLEWDDTRAVALGDVDGDGDVDAFIGNGHYSNSQQNRLYLNDGAGVFYDATSQIPVDDDETLAVALGDVDGDGDLDVFLGNGFGGVTRQNRLYLNDGTGAFTDATYQIPYDSVATHTVALADVDGDGDLDAFLGNTYPSGYFFYGVNYLYLNNGSGVFTDASHQVPNNNDDVTAAVALGDVDGDGDLDAFLGKVSFYLKSHGQNCLYLNDGKGFFTDATKQIPIDSDETLAVALGDVDGDGDLDAFLGNYYGSSQNRLYLNDGKGKFRDATNKIPVDSDRTAAVALGDVDGDGDLDAFIGNYLYYSQNRLYLNEGNGVFSDATIQIPAHASDDTFALALGDVDGDGDLDAFIGNGAEWNVGEQNRLYLNDGAGFFTDWIFHQIPLDDDQSNAVALGDVDGDGNRDIFVANCGQNQLYLNDGAGVFTYATSQIPINDDYSYAVALVDVDDDGDLDAIVGNHGQNRLCINDGAGVFTDAPNQIPSDNDVTRGGARGDVDGDGDRDVFVANCGQNQLYLNDGAGVFTYANSQIPINDDYSYAVALGDVDGDGDLDALIGNNGQQNRLYLNDGAGVFTDASTQIPADSDETNVVALGDVDGDGDLDALIGNDGQQNRLYLNDSKGNFTDATHQIPLDNDRTKAVVLGDVDDDGDLDALIGNFYTVGIGGANKLYLNDGAGFFTDAANLIPADDDGTCAVAFGDLDGDSDLDAFIGNYSQNRLYSNLTRQLAWRGLPRIGKPLAMDLYGPANGTYRLAASRAMDSVPMPPYGILRIDLGQIFYQGKGGLDGEGRASVDFDVPANPNLNGMSFYFQALVGPPDKLTNLEIATVTNL